MPSSAAPDGHRALVCAPYGSDARTVARLLDGNGYDARVCPDVDAVAGAIDTEVGVVLLTEEALAPALDRLREALAAQPPWSDIPFILLASRRSSRFAPIAALRDRLLESTGNAIVLERPLGITSLLSAAASAIRARRRQFEMRDRMAELDTQYARLNTLLDNLPVGVAFINPDRSTLIANPAFRRFRPDGSIPSARAGAEAEWEAYDGAGRRLGREGFAVARALRGEHVFGAEYRFRPARGEPVWTRVSAIPLRGPGGRITGAVAVVVDIDDQKRAQEALADAADQLERQVAARTADLSRALERLKAETAERERVEASLRQSQKMDAVGQLTGGIAHDFNNMLTGVIGSLDIMRRRIAAGRVGDLDRYMEAASASAARAAALTQRLLAFSRRQSLDPRAVNVNEVIASVRELIEGAIHERIGLRIVLAPELPLALVDANQLENAVLNLVINARDAMPSGGMLTVETSAVELDEAYVAARPGIAPGRYIVVAVSDTGVGMSAELIEKVFDPFFTTKPLGQGTGLGLSMVYGFAKQSGGQVRIHSQPGVGTSVKIHLPVTDAPGPAATAPMGTAASGDGERVLVVEDDEAVRMLVREVLEELHYRSVEFAEPFAAVRHLASDERIDLMISDVGLPGMNGRELAETARAHRPGLPILFITGYAENAAIRAGFLGANMAMVTKPFSLDELAAKVRLMVGAK
ncbi:MAG: response regulator [Alphaproteobacteria bacterium]